MTYPRLLEERWKGSCAMLAVSRACEFLKEDLGCEGVQTSGTRRFLSLPAPVWPVHLHNEAHLRLDREASHLTVRSAGYARCLLPTSRQLTDRREDQTAGHQLL